MSRKNAYYVGRVTKQPAPNMTKGRLGRIPDTPRDVAYDLRGSLSEMIEPRLPTRLDEMRDMLRERYGSYRAVSRELGVSPRTLERYIAQEQHHAVTRQSLRGLNPELRDELREHMQELVRPQMIEERLQEAEEGGVDIAGDFLLRWSDTASWRHVRGHISASEWRGIANAWRAGHYDKAGRMTSQAFLRTYRAGSARLEGTQDVTLHIR